MSAKRRPATPMKRTRVPQTPQSTPSKVPNKPPGESPTNLPKTPEGINDPVSESLVNKVNEDIQSAYIARRDINKAKDEMSIKRLRANLLYYESILRRLLNSKARIDRFNRISDIPKDRLTEAEKAYLKKIKESNDVNPRGLMGLQNKFYKAQEWTGLSEWEEVLNSYNELLAYYRQKKNPQVDEPPAETQSKNEATFSNAKEPEEITQQEVNNAEKTIVTEEMSGQKTPPRDIQDIEFPTEVSDPAVTGSSSSSSSSTPSPSSNNTPKTPAQIAEDIAEIDRYIQASKKRIQELQAAKKLVFESPPTDANGEPDNEGPLSMIEISDDSLYDEPSEIIDDPENNDSNIIDDEEIDEPAEDESLRGQLGIPEHNGAFPEPTISGNRKWGPDRAEWQKEDQRRRMQQSPHDRLRTAEALLVSSLKNPPEGREYDRLGVSSEDLETYESHVTAETPKAMAQKRVGMAMQLADDIFAADFRAWLTNGRTIIHEKPEVRNVVAKRPGNRAFRFQRDRDPQTRISENKQYRLPATPLWSSLHKIRGAQEYIDTFVDQEAAFQRKLNAMLLRGPQTVDEAFWYYKFVIRGEVASAEDKELFNQL